MLNIFRRWLDVQPAQPVGERIILRSRRRIFPTIIGLAAVGGIIAATEFGPILVGCSIKGNISKSTGERIYHTLGQEYYVQTRINWLSGERWFCSEADARAAGWRKSRS